MIELSENAFRAYELAKRESSSVELDGLRHFVIGFFSGLRYYHASAITRQARQAIVELERAGLLMKIEGEPRREIICIIQGTFVSRNQKVHEVQMTPDNEIQIIAESKKKRTGESLSLEILLTSQYLLQTLSKAKKLLSSAIAIVKKSRPSIEERKKLKETIRQLEELSPKATAGAEAIGLEAAIKALREFLKTKPQAASQS